MLGTKIIIITCLIAGIFTINNGNIQNSGHGEKFQATKWIKHMVKDIKKNNLHQILFICNCIEKNQRFLEIISNVGTSIPNIITDYKNLTQKNYTTMTTHNPRASTLFIIIECFHKAFNTSRIAEIAKMVKEITATKMRPKCLGILLYETKKVVKFEKLLRETWNDVFLDFSIIEVYPQVANGGKQIQMLHYFNCFSNKYIKLRFSSKMQLFPNKMNDLKGYGIKVGTFHRPPFGFVKRNSSGHPIDTDGSDVRISKIFSDVMNFRMILVSSFKEDYEKFDCNKSKATGFHHDILHNLIQFLNIQSIHVSLACEHETNDITLFGLTHYSAVVPIKRVTNYSVSLGTNFLVTTVETLLIGILIFLTAKFFKFSKTIWIYPNIMRAILGLTISQQPWELKERIIYGTIFLLSIFNTTIIFAGLTDVHFHHEEEITISSLKDLSKSHLKIYVHENIYTVITKSEDSSILDMLENNKKFRSHEFVEECLSLLVMQKDVGCIGKQSVIQTWINRHTDSQGRPLMKLIPEALFTTTEGFIMEPGSPYVEKFNALMSNLQQSGIFSKLKGDFNRESFKEYNEDSGESNALNVYLMLWLLICGYSVSIFVFAIEYFFAYGKNCFGSQLIC